MLKIIAITTAIVLLATVGSADAASASDAPAMVEGITDLEVRLTTPSAGSTEPMRLDYSFDAPQTNDDSQWGRPYAYRFAIEPEGVQPNTSSTFGGADGDIAELSATSDALQRGTLSMHLLDATGAYRFWVIARYAVPGLSAIASAPVDYVYPKRFDTVDFQVVPPVVAVLSPSSVKVSWRSNTGLSSYSIRANGSTEVRTATRTDMRSTSYIMKGLKPGAYSFQALGTPTNPLLNDDAHQQTREVPKWSTSVTVKLIVPSVPGRPHLTEQVLAHSGVSKLTASVGRSSARGGYPVQFYQQQFRMWPRGHRSRSETTSYLQRTVSGARPLVAYLGVGGWEYQTRARACNTAGRRFTADTTPVLCGGYSAWSNVVLSKQGAPAVNK